MSKLSKDEIERWITLDNGVHVPIKKGETEEDVKNRLDEWNKQNSKKKSYRDILKEKDIYEATAQFIADNHVGVSESVLEEVDDESLVQVYDTLREIKERHKDLNVSKMKLYNEKTVDDCDPNAFAGMADDGTLYLNSIYFSQKPNDITELYQESVNDKFHPKCPDGIAGIITHEVGHMEFFHWMQTTNEKLKGTDKDYNAVYSYLGGYKNEMTGNEPLYVEFYKKVKPIQDKIQNNEAIKKAWGKKPNLSLQGLADPGKGASGVSISRYASYSIFEMMAESFADVFWNGKNAALMSRMLCNEFYKEK